MQEAGYCECGCGEKTEPYATTDPRQGGVKGEPKRFIRGHARSNYKPLRWIEEDRGYLTPCWIWQLSLTRDGYGGVAHSTAYKAVYEQHRGPVPDGLQLDHLCRVRACVNPDHLEPVTHIENVRRGANTKLSVDKAREIRALLVAGRSQSEIAVAFGVAQSLISAINTGRAWKDGGR